MNEIDAELLRRLDELSDADRRALLAHVRMVDAFERHDAMLADAAAVGGLEVVVQCHLPKCRCLVARLTGERLDILIAPKRRGGTYDKAGKTFGVLLADADRGQAPPAPCRTGHDSYDITAVASVAVLGRRRNRHKVHLSAVHTV